MNKPLLSVIIPSHNDIYLWKTIASLLGNALLPIEVVVTLDGYIPGVFPIEDDRIKYQYHGKSLGMREAINTAVEASTGAYVMRTDEHCMFAPGFDRALCESPADNWITVPRRYKLDPVTWRRMDDLGFIDYEKLLIVEKTQKGKTYQKFSAVQWKARERERADIMIDETMAMQGSCWVMRRSWWDKVIGRLQSEGYGPLYQDSTEMAFKTWAAGGKLMVNKNTWYAHKHRDFNRTHHYPLERAIPEWQYALNRHRKEYEHMREVFGI